MERSGLRTRDTNTDVMRLIASFFVVMIHVSATGGAVGSAWNSISRFSVPMFVLISGYYLLDKNLGISAVLKKVASLFAVMVAWSAVYYCHGLMVHTQEFSLLGCVKYLLTEPVHLWYFYALMALYLFTPLLNLVYHHASKEVYRYILVLTFLSGTCLTMLLRVDSLSFLAVIVEKMKFPYALGFFFLYLLGGYIRKYTITRKKAVYCIGLAASLLSAVAAAVFAGHAFVNDVLFSFFYPGNVLAAFAFFLFCNSHSLPKSDKLATVLRTCAGATLGVYVLHPLIMTLFAPYDFLAGSALLIPIRALVMYTISLGCSSLLKRIPVLKRLV